MLGEFRDAHERWLSEEIPGRYAEMQRDPAKAVDLDEARARFENGHRADMVKARQQMANRVRLHELAEADLTRIHEDMRDDVGPVVAGNCVAGLYDFIQRLARSQNVARCGQARFQGCVSLAIATRLRSVCG